MKLWSRFSRVFYVPFPLCATVEEVKSIRVQLARRDAAILAAFTGSALSILIGLVGFSLPTHLYILLLACSVLALTVRVNMTVDNRVGLQRLLIATSTALVIGLSLLGGTASSLVYYVVLAVLVGYSLESKKWRSGFYAVLLIGFLVSVYRFRHQAAIHITDTATIMQISMLDVMICVLVAGLLIRIHTDYGLLIARSGWHAAAKKAASIERSRKINAQLEDDNTKATQASRETAAALRSELRAAAQLRASAEQLEQFSYAASHDLKEPVRTIRSFAQLAERRFQKASSESSAATVNLGELFTQISDSATSMHVLLERLLVYSRAERSNVQRCDDHAPNTTLQLAAHHAEGKGFKVDLVIPEASLPTLTTDPEMLKEALLELVDNAVAFGGIGAHGEKRIEIGAVSAPGSGHMLFWVRDFGPGVAAAHREEVCGIFRRLRTHPAAEGAGMGLAIARSLSRSLGGDIELRSPVEGGGTEAVLWLPS